MQYIIIFTWQVSMLYIHLVPYIHVFEVFSKMLRLFDVLCCVVFKCFVCSCCESVPWNVPPNRWKNMLIYPYACTIPKIHYKEDLGQGTAISGTPEMERVKRNQEAISTVHCGVTHPVSQNSQIMPPFNTNSD